MTSIRDYIIIVESGLKELAMPTGRRPGKPQKTVRWKAPGGPPVWRTLPFNGMQGSIVAMKWDEPDLGYTWHVTKIGDRPFEDAPLAHDSHPTDFDAAQTACEQAMYQLAKGEGGLATGA